MHLGAFSISLAVRDLTASKAFYEDLGFTTLTSNIVPGNTRSIRLAERMGAVYERTYDNPNMGGFGGGFFSVPSESASGNRK